MIDKVLSGIMGLCVADAVGVPVEFKSRATLKDNPVTNMRGYGTYNQPPGTWSDDSSMTLCLLDSLVNGVNYNDIMSRFASWLNDSAYTPYNEVFDVGNATRTAIGKFSAGEPPLRCGGTEGKSNGNGSLMRILPLAFYLHALYGTEIFQHDDAVEIIHNVSSLTHAHPCSQIACGIYISIAGFLMGGPELPYAVDLGLGEAHTYYEQHKKYSFNLKKYSRIFDSNFINLPEEAIRSSGYVVDTLEAALWCLLTTTSYERCVLKAVNLGEDTDTVAAVAGGLAGMYYGYEAIPENWIANIPRKDYIIGLCNNLSRNLDKVGIKALLQFLPFFQEINENNDIVNWCKGLSGRTSFDHEAISEKINLFSKVFCSTGVPVSDYSSVLNDSGFTGRDVDELPQSLLANADLLQTRAILTWHFRRDHFSEGSLVSSSIANGRILALLQHLKSLIESN